MDCEPTNHSNLNEIEVHSLFKEMMKYIKDIQYKHYKISYRKAHYEYSYNNNIEQAKKYIDETIKLFVSSDDDKYLSDFLIQNGVDYIFIASIMKVKPMKVFELAGQIYAQLAESYKTLREASITNYQKYQVYLQEFKTHEELQGLENIAVYSFRPVSNYALADLANGTITVARPTKMNDPFDSIANIWKKTDNLRKITNRKGHEDLLSESMNYYRIRSFVWSKETEAEDYVLNNIRMWSAYAKDHYGFCVKYRLHKGFIHNVDTNNFTVRRLAPVKYIKEFQMNKTITAIDSYEAYNMKHECWKYENEIRLLSYNTSTGDDFYSEPMGSDAEIEEIIFGVMCSDEDKKKIFNILSSKDVKFYRMEPNPAEDIYHLIKKEYNPST